MTLPPEYFLYRRRHHLTYLLEIFQWTTTKSPHFPRQLHSDIEQRPNYQPIKKNSIIWRATARMPTVFLNTPLLRVNAEKEKKKKKATALRRCRLTKTETI